ncbi:MAG: GNAT family N-acetyltransferase [Candidatus Eremiobacteraeota bacterium]|nr:GNAT family N-acetyltransferase [Candidatus Eremiobacteraeota bacterium]
MPSYDDLVLTTQRLELRVPTIDDAQAIFDAYASDPRVTTYMDWRPSQHVTEVAERNAALAPDIAEGKRIPWVIRKLDEERLCGSIELRIEGDEGDVGYVLAASHWGQEIMPEALSAVLQFALERLSLRRVRGICDVENRASARVFEKCGFRWAGRREASVVHPNISDAPRDADCYEIELPP